MPCKSHPQVQILHFITFSPLDSISFVTKSFNSKFLVTQCFIIAGSEALKIHVDASTEAVSACIKYLYTDSVDKDDISEDLIGLATKYSLTQLKDYCLPTFISSINPENCLTMFVYGYKHGFLELKNAAFKYLDDHWEMHSGSSGFLDMMKNCPNAVLEIMCKLQKNSDCQPIVLENVKPRLVDF